MIAQAQGVISKSVGAISSSGSALKTLAGAHPVVLGVVLGIGAYYAVNEYLLNKDVDDDEAVEAEAETVEEEADEGIATA